MDFKTLRTYRVATNTNIVIEMCLLVTLVTSTTLWLTIEHVKAFMDLVRALHIILYMSAFFIAKRIFVLFCQTILHCIFTLSVACREIVYYVISFSSSMICKKIKQQENMLVNWGHWKRTGKRVGRVGGKSWQSEGDFSGLKPEFV